MSAKILAYAKKTGKYRSKCRLCIVFLIGKIVTLFVFIFKWNFFAKKSYFKIWLLAQTSIGERWRVVWRHWFSMTQHFSTTSLIFRIVRIYLDSFNHRMKLYLTFETNTERFVNFLPIMHIKLNWQIKNSIEKNWPEKIKCLKYLKKSMNAIFQCYISGSKSLKHKLFSSLS